MDPDTKVDITDTSANNSEHVREYSMFIDDTYTVSDFVKVTDPWRFQQQIKFSESSALNWMNMHVFYNGDKWEQSLSWDGKYDLSIETTSGSFNKFNFDHPEIPNTGFLFEQTLDMDANTWMFLLSDENESRVWRQLVDLTTGTFDQEYSVDSTLVWKDSWNMDGTVYNPNQRDGAPSTSTLLATADSESASVESEEGTDYTTAAIVSASALTLSIFACAYI